jgi:hypothetical protein
MRSCTIGLVLVAFILHAASLPLFAEETAGDNAITEITQVAQKFPRHQGPTYLYVNFDGWTNYDGKKHDIQPFKPMSGSKGRDIQLILFRTAELFAPFDVQVRRLRGAGKHDERNRGNTTVFIGANTLNIKEKQKYLSAFTPGNFTDRPGKTKGDNHRPNSDPYDLAFVDPVGGEGDASGWQTKQDVMLIAQAIAHEAGHTFGLSHTLTKPTTEMMSYDARNLRFVNKAYPISDLNYDPVQKKALPKGDVMLPFWGKQAIRQQNSYTYLQAVLGARQRDDHASVADRSAVDPTFRDGPLQDLPLGAATSGVIDHRGDYDVFLLRASGDVTVEVRPVASSRLAPVLFLIDSTGKQLLGFANSKASTDRVARASIKAEQGKPCKVVVGAADCGTDGGYEVTARKGGP